MAYRIEIERRAIKTLGRLPKREQARLLAATDVLAEDPRPPGCTPVRAAPKGTYRVRVGDYRLVYLVLNDERVIVVARVARRSETTYPEVGHGLETEAMATGQQVYRERRGEMGERETSHRGRSSACRT